MSSGCRCGGRACTDGYYCGLPGGPNQQQHKTLPYAAAAVAAAAPGRAVYTLVFGWWAVTVRGIEGTDYGKLWTQHTAVITGSTTSTQQHTETRYTASSSSSSSTSSCRQNASAFVWRTAVRPSKAQTTSSFYKLLLSRPHRWCTPAGLRRSWAS